MSSMVVEPGADRVLRFYRASIGKKAVMAATGFVLFGYVLAHLLGNLQIYLGRNQINRYAELLHAFPALLWVARLVLLAVVGLHMFTSLQLWLLKRKARPSDYIKYSHVPPGYASRTMLWTGPLIALYVVYHVLHLTTGDAGLPFIPLDAYDNVVGGFLMPAVSIVYILAMLALSMHLYHGLWSMFQSLGVSHPRRTPFIKRCAAGLAIVIAAGFISIPFAVLVGLVR